MVYAEEKIQRHSLSLDLGGHLSFISSEYQYLFYSQEKHHFALTVGAGTMFMVNAFPLGLNYYYGVKHQVFAGVQFVPYYYYAAIVYPPSLQSWFWDFSLSPRIGYRFNMKKFFLHAYFSPISSLDTWGFLPWGGLGIGMYF